MHNLNDNDEAEVRYISKRNPRYPTHTYDYIIGQQLPPSSTGEI